MSRGNHILAQLKNRAALVMKTDRKTAKEVDLAISSLLKISNVIQKKTFLT